ncbi:ABC transporter permease [bacterium]|nr:ABC transporter permease [bacterium]MCI0601723.1 ABC transporter permease [bacterium]
MNFIDFVLNNYGQILNLSFQHLYLAVVSTLIAALIGIPAGVLLTRKPALSPTILGIANVLQTVPSLALLGFMLSIPFLGGIGAGAAITALVLYALLPVIRNTYTGIASVDPAVREAGRGMGMTDRQLLLMVEMPLASGVIFAGLRIAMVVSIGVATVAAAIGAGGLGEFIFRGLSTVNNTLILAGAVPAALLAIAVDFGLGKIEKRWSKNL